LSLTLVNVTLQLGMALKIKTKNGKSHLGNAYVSYVDPWS